MNWLRKTFEITHTSHTAIRSMEGIRGFAVFLVFLVHYNTPSWWAIHQITTAVMLVSHFLASCCNRLYIVRLTFSPTLRRSSWPRLNSRVYFLIACPLVKGKSRGTPSGCMAYPSVRVRAARTHRLFGATVSALAKPAPPSTKRLLCI